jgi:D-alanyl-D-alanine carboxypeptidase/D-alanyl-D-alanine-endopeptidase (penicillin-binding protein 4)
MSPVPYCHHPVGSAARSAADHAEEIRQHDCRYRLSHHRSRPFGVPGTWRAGSDAVRQILRQQAGVDLGNTIIADGSGLSRHNLIAPATMMQVLQYIAQHDTELNFISMLPLAGHDGSLQYRAGLHQAGVDGKVSAKTVHCRGL